VKTKVVVVLPAYNAAQTVARTVRDVPPGCADELVLVDDASRDDTVAVAERLGLTVVRHAENRGYGGNQKTCYREAWPGARTLSSCSTPITNTTRG
jgi:glycosyltransferase involved in cell wall biosynthesis